MAFEQLMAEATAKREKKEDKKKESRRSHFGHAHKHEATATEEKAAPAS